MNIDQLLDELPSDDSVSTLTLDTDITPVGPCCEKCAAPLAAHESLVCQQCGWYASINAYVEIDRSWEIATDPELASEDDSKPAPSAKLPAWAWILASCIVGVIVESMAARLLTSGAGGLRTLWSLSQLFLGFVAFTFCHTLCFLQVMKNEADVKMLDYLLRPIKSWSIIFRGMPDRGWVCYVGLSGLTAVAMSVLLIGGIPYERLLDWNIKERAKTNLMGAILDQAGENGAEDDNTLEEAIGDFAGQEELDEDKKKKAAKNARKKEDCIIIGYMTKQSGEVHTLLLAAEHFSKLKYAGSVRVAGSQKKTSSNSLRSYLRVNHANRLSEFRSTGRHG